MGCTIIGCGKALPALEVSNDELANVVDTNDEWIVTRTGISSRHIAVDETTLDLATNAARRALGWDSGGWQSALSEGQIDTSTSSSHIDADSIDLVVCMTITSDVIVPSLAAEVKRRLGLTHAIAFDLNAACTGFIYGLTVAESMMAASATASDAIPGAAGRNPVRRALVIGADRLSALTDWTDRSTCVLFGDGAGAAVLSWEPEQTGVVASFVKNTDDPTGALAVPHGFDRETFPFDQQGVRPECRRSEASEGSTSSEEAALVRVSRAYDQDGNEAPQSITMDGQKVFKFAAEAMAEAVRTVLDRANLNVDEIACIVPHQANERIIKYAAKKLGLPMERFQLSIANAGNTSAASVPMALADAYTSGHITPGDKVILVGFGGGFTSGGVLYQA